ncbi:putative reverse transcriptase domain-containing protein [Tanacetum coccineum]|uniref:Reverse transcriptase domain-containing protein n=1 Tax=Tanacetum coccineum TaxID=301880 RepID=A0ABQ5AUM5_9ASTR
MSSIFLGIGFSEWKPYGGISVFKGLKQGDPLSLFIFILVMESLHISFKRVVDAGMFNGIVLNSVMHLSHMFYADDAVFMGQWSTKNIDTIIYVLKCFHRASGLSINLSKSKLLGVVVSEDRVVQAANRIGCGVLKAPFAYLGSKVGGNMSRIKSWDEIVDKMKGGLGVSSLYALNRALMCKWVWRFTTQKNLLWTRVIKAIHGEDGKNSSGFKVGYKSIWQSILQEVETLKIKGELGTWSFRRAQKRSGNKDQLEDLTPYGEVSTQTRWIKAVPIKVNIHAWKVRMDCLPTRLNISRRALERIVIASGLGDVLNYAFLASRLQSASLQTKLLLHSGIVASGPAFNDALCAFNVKMETDLLSNESEIAAPKLMKKLADIYFTRVTQTAESTFSLSSRQIALWQSQMEDHTSDWLRVVPISGLGQTMNGKTYRCVLCYRLGVPLFSVSKPCSACSKVFTRDIYGDHAVSCAGIIGIKHRHNVVRDTLVDICFRSGISAGKEVDIGLGGGCDKLLRLADMLLYSWDERLDVCVDLTGSSPLTQTGMVNFVPGRAVIDAAHRKRVKYEAKCADIGYGFLLFSFSSLGELDKDVVTLLKRIRKFSVTQDIGARVVVHIFNRISFAIAKGVGAQLVSRLPTNFL